MSLIARSFLVLYSWSFFGTDVSRNVIVSDPLKSIAGMCDFMGFLFRFTPIMDLLSEVSLVLTIKND